MPNTVVSSAHKDRVRQKEVNKTGKGDTHKDRRTLSRIYEIEAT